MVLSVRVCVCVRAHGAGVTPHAWNDGCRGGRRRGEEPVCSGVRAVMVQSGGECGALTLGGEFVFSFHVSHLSMHLFVRFSSIPPPFFSVYVFISTKRLKKKKSFLDLFSGFLGDGVEGSWFRVCGHNI